MGFERRNYLENVLCPQQPQTFRLFLTIRPHRCFFFFNKGPIQHSLLANNRYRLLLAHFQNDLQDPQAVHPFSPYFRAVRRRNFCFFADGASVERRALVRVVFRSVVKFVMICATGRAPPTHQYLSSIRSWKVQFTDKLGGAMIYV